MGSRSSAIRGSWKPTVRKASKVPNAPLPTSSNCSAKATKPNKPSSSRKTGEPPRSRARNR